MKYGQHQPLAMSKVMRSKFMRWARASTDPVWKSRYAVAARNWHHIWLRTGV